MVIVIFVIVYLDNTNQLDKHQNTADLSSFHYSRNDH